jgi:hypothetical protein
MEKEDLSTPQQTPPILLFWSYVTSLNIAQLGSKIYCFTEIVGVCFTRF